WVTIVWKSYWSAPTALALAPVYQFQPWTSVMLPSLSHPRTPSARPPAALVSLMWMITVAHSRSASLTSVMNTPKGLMTWLMPPMASEMRARSWAVTLPAELSTYTTRSPARRVPAVALLLSPPSALRVLLPFPVRVIVLLTTAPGSVPLPVRLTWAAL